MKVTTEELNTFKHIYKMRFNLDINDDEARVKLATLLRQMTVIYKPITVKQLHEYKHKGDVKC